MAGHYHIHIGDGDERQTYDCDFNKLLNAEFIAIERLTGLTLTGVAQGLMEASAMTVTALVWVLRRRQEPTLRFDQVEFKMADMELEEVDEAGQAAPKEATPIKRAKKAG